MSSQTTNHLFYRKTKARFENQDAVHLNLLPYNAAVLLTSGI